MSALLKLRDYQTEAIKDLHTRWDAGAVRVPMVLATGLGKTVIFAHVVADYVRTTAVKRALVLVHTDELAQQAYKKIKDVAPDLHVGIVKAEQNQVTARVIVGSVQTLRNAKRRAQIRNVGLIIVDECFPAGTLIGGKPIESLRSGDVVPSWNEITGEEESRPVVALMKRRPSGMVRISLADGTDFACTPNHPIMTTAGWCPAGGLWRGAEVVSFTHDANAGSELYGVRKSGGLDGEGADRHLSANGPDVLSGSLPGRMGEPRLLGQDGADQPPVCLGPDAPEQSDGSAGIAGEDGSHLEGNQTSATLAWRKREADPRTTGAVGDVSRLAHGDDCGSERRRTSISLQNRYSSSLDEGLRGSGRGIPLLAGPPSLRPAPGRTAITTRVDCIEILEPGSDGTYGGVCPDGFVYNIEVASTHTYLVGERGIVAHNCHHATATTYRTILEHFGAFSIDLTDHPDFPERSEPRIKVAGFTATLARGDKEKLSDVWEACTFQRGISFGIRRGYLTDVRGIRVVVPDLDLTKVKKSGGDYQDGSLEQELDRSLAPSIVAAKFLEHAAERKAIGFAPTVASAEHFAQAFTEAGISTAVVHGALPREERRLVLKKLHTGDVQVVWNCAVLTEGFDEPTVSCVIGARPTRSAPLYQQMIGRGLRPDLTLPPERRGDCLVLDVVGASKDHTLRTLVDLSEREIREEIAEDDLLSLLEMEIAEEIAEAAEPESEQAEEYYGVTAVEAFDPLARAGIGAWLRTTGGTYFLPAGSEVYVLLVPSEENGGLWDVAWLTQDASAQRNGSAGDITEHRGLSLEMATSWAEEVLEEIGGPGALSLADRRKRWRKGEPSEGQLYRARRMGIELTGEESKGEVSDRISETIASQRIDPIVAFMIAARS